MPSQLSESDVAMMWSRIRDNSIALGLQLYTWGPRYPLAYMTNNWGTTTNSGFIFACLAFHEFAPENTTTLIRLAAGTQPSTHYCTRKYFLNVRSKFEVDVFQSKTFESIALGQHDSRPYRHV